jgi:hypothetical protein
VHSIQIFIIQMKSKIVVISWWSNCLGLECLHRLCQYASNRDILVIQVGKQEHVKRSFRNYMPDKVTELILPDNQNEEHWAVCEWIVRHELAHEKGLWFFDHDSFLLESYNEWLNDMDFYLLSNRFVLAHLSENGKLSITNPLFWISPSRLPKLAPGFSPIPPPENKAIANTPFDRAETVFKLKSPEKDTMVACAEFLNNLGLVAHLSSRNRETGIPLIPSFQHLGGLHLLTINKTPKFLENKVQQVKKRLTAILSTCPAEWLKSEDNVLINRLNV